MRWIPAVLSVFLVLAVGEARTGFNEGKAAYDRGDYATALREWRPLAEQGLAKAQYNLGVMYRDGEGVPQNYAEAVAPHRHGRRKTPKTSRQRCEVPPTFVGDRPIQTEKISRCA